MPTVANFYEKTVKEILGLKYGDWTPAVTDKLVVDASPSVVSRYTGTLHSAVSSA